MTTATRPSMSPRRRSASNPARHREARRTTAGRTTAGAQQRAHDSGRTTAGRGARRSGGRGGGRRGQGSGRRLKPAPNVVTLGLASNTPRRRPLNKQKLAVVISTFYRISRSCNSWTNIVDAVSNMKNELLSLKYPLRVLLRAAGRMATTDARWASIEGAWRADSRR